MTKIILIRHGNTFDKGDVIRRVGCRTDLPLSSSGREQAERLGTHMKAAGFTPDTVFTSGLKRTQETALRALGVIGESRPLQVRPELNEIDYGPDEGQPEDQVVARVGELALKDWDEHGVMPAEWSPRPDVIRAQVKSLLNGVAGSAQDGDIIWMVTSNGVARFIGQATTWDCPEPEHLKLSTAAHSILEYRKGAWVMTAWNVKPTL